MTWVVLSTGLLGQAGDVASLHDGLVAEIDVDAEKYANGIVTVAHIVLNLFLWGGRERG